MNHLTSSDLDIARSTIADWPRDLPFPPEVFLYTWEVPRCANAFLAMGYVVRVIPRRIGEEGYTLGPLRGTKGRLSGSEPEPRK